MADRTPRAQKTREDEERTVTWRPAGALPVPEPREGITFRWIRSNMLGSQDTVNMSAKFREGWTPVTASEFPELGIVKDVDTRFPEGIEVGGLVLCQAPAELMEQKRAYQDGVAAQQMSAVDRNFMREGDSRMPLLSPERNSRVSKFGS